MDSTFKLNKLKESMQNQNVFYGPMNRLVGAVDVESATKSSG